jgi:hypothetical protein
MTGLWPVSDFGQLITELGYPSTHQNYTRISDSENLIIAISNKKVRYEDLDHGLREDSLIHATLGAP